MARPTHTAGLWALVSEVTTQQWTDLAPCGDGLYAEVVSGEMVWIKARDGSVYGRDLRHGENLETVAAYYRKRGHIDDDAILMF